MIRGDSGFCREPIMAWCEANSVDYLFGLAQNKRLLKRIAEPMEQAQQQFQATKQPARVFVESGYPRTWQSWSRVRRVVAKAEHLEKGANPQFRRHLDLLPKNVRPSLCMSRTTAARGEDGEPHPRSSNCICSPIAPACFRQCGPTPLSENYSSPRSPTCVFDCRHVAASRT